MIDFVPRIYNFLNIKDKQYLYSKKNDETRLNE